VDNADHRNKIKDYFDTTLKNHGATPRGVDWNNEETRAARFDQLLKIIKPGEEFSLLDYGCGYGALIDYLNGKQYLCSHYFGFDISESMISAANEIYKKVPWAIFSSHLEELPPADYATACGVFNMKQDAGYDSWTEFVLRSLREMDTHSTKGFSVNFLTKYSDPDRMRKFTEKPFPAFLFDYCKRNFSKNVALLHDYALYDFTLLIRKNL